MEKALLVTILLGLLYLALRRLVKAKSAVVNKDEVEDWSKYDVPAFIRRGIPMPALKPVSAKHTKVA